jgi:hypothetical protein
MSDVTYEDVPVESGDKIITSSGKVQTISGKGELAGQVCFEEGFSVAPHLLKEDLADPESDVRVVDETVEVHEDKFNGTATLNIDATTKDRAKSAARQYFRDVHGTTPSKIVAGENPHRYVAGEKTQFTVMVADHSSGSLCDSDEYTF